MPEVNPETMKLINEFHAIACSAKASAELSTEKMNTPYERLSSEILKRDRIIAELEAEIEEQVNVIISQKEQLQRGY